MNKKGVDRPIREEIDVDFKRHLSDEEEAGDFMEADATTDEEIEMPGTTRPEGGTGWSRLTAEASQEGHHQRVRGRVGVCRPQGDGPCREEYCPIMTLRRRSRGL